MEATMAFMQCRERFVAEEPIDGDSVKPFEMQTFRQFLMKRLKRLKRRTFEETSLPPIFDEEIEDADLPPIFDEEIEKIDIFTDLRCRDGGSCADKKANGKAKSKELKLWKAREKDQAQLLKCP
ncbi:hypothetical protein QJS04_geneDACA021147 [Acorus gramineus]|uniref:Uncharacterized protein n=1 Tax=Acorus gramineus TaxID=55184 RepID=A0AAV9AE32_ACOGR|nr:hypothetical protein QJS04_geneDACA021147 [Acorus gramineus]